jgi:hypothetical protein
MPSIYIFFFLNCRLTTGYALRHMFEPSSCAVCQLRLIKGQGISIHANPLQHEKMQGWQGPFLCRSCHEKKEAMEGKRRPIGIDDLIGYLKYTLCSSLLDIFLNHGTTGLKKLLTRYCFLLLRKLLTWCLFICSDSSTSDGFSHVG